MINEISGIGLFLFKSRAKAKEFAILISGYFLNSVKNCKTGQRFWPDFRILMAEAINHRELENIHKSRTYLDNAIFNRDRLRSRKLRDKSEKGEERVSNEKLFYPEDKK
jgi:hypothetical protein